MTIKRETIHIASVRSRMLEPGYGYIRISVFQADTGNDFHKHLGQLKQQAGGKLRGLLLDLRSNPGGLLTAAVQVADALLDKETLSVRVAVFRRVIRALMQRWEIYWMVSRWWYWSMLVRPALRRCWWVR